MLVLKLRMHCWIQIPEEQVKNYKKELNLLTGNDYHYTNPAEKNMVEFHIDSCSDFQKEMNKQTECGGIS